MEVSRSVVLPKSSTGLEKSERESARFQRGAKTPLGGTGGGPRFSRLIVGV